MSEPMKDYPPYLDYPKPRKKQTNADKIRSMTDEELALYLAWTADPDTLLIVNYRLYECHDRSIEDTLEWLKQEVPDNGKTMETLPAGL